MLGIRNEHDQSVVRAFYFQFFQYLYLSYFKRLGSKRISPTLGIIWNNEMDDFRLILI